jgi:hypothetical protein
MRVVVFSDYFRNFCGDHCSLVLQRKWTRPILSCKKTSVSQLFYILTYVLNMTSRNVQNDFIFSAAWLIAHEVLNIYFLSDYMFIFSS